MSFVVHKLLSFVLTLFVISIVTFMALNVLPGDPAVVILGTEGNPMALAQLRMELGLNINPIQRYVQWLSNLLRGDLGYSIRYNVPVTTLISGALPLTIQLAVFGVGLALLVSIPVGISQAISQGSFATNLGTVISQLGMAMPAFWLGIVLINIFAVKLGWFMPSGYASVASLVLPSIALAIPRAAIFTRVVATSIDETLRQDYLRTARSKGLPERVVLYKHALKNAAISILSVVGIHLTQLLAGTIVIEQVFGLPGFGQLILAAVTQRDFPLVQGLVVIAAAFILFVNLLIDLLLVVLDPRIRLE